MSAYLKKLAQGARNHDAPTSFKQKVERWFADQPEVSRYRPYSMEEIERGTSIAARHVGEVLNQLGWTRHRRWSSKTSYRRYWLPPG